MEQTYPVVEFEAEMDDEGVIAVPPLLARSLRSRRVVVRVVEGTFPGSLRTRGVHEEEVERIASLQLERRENVVDFLQAEGALAKNAPFARRAAEFLKRRS